jgi:hypothetical protein
MHTLCRAWTVLFFEAIIEPPSTNFHVFSLRR